MRRLLVCAVAALAVFVGRSEAQQRTRATDPRFYPFVGCWRADSAAPEADARGDAFNCIVPVAGSSDVELVDVVDGRVAERRRIDATGRPRAVYEQGCRGQEQASASSEPRRVYLHAEFICTPNGMAGGRTTLMSMLPNGDRLEIESVRAGGGSITRVQRYRDAGVPSSLPRDVAVRLGGQRLALMTARAAAASPLETRDVVEALRHADSSVVRAWLAATAQPFQLNGDEVASLVRAGVPAPVLQAMLGGAPSYQLGVGVDASGRSTDEYLSAPGVPGGGVTRMTTAAPLSSPVYGSVNVYDGCCMPGYSSYNGYAPVSGVSPYYPGAYGVPYVSYYDPYPVRRYPVNRGGERRGVDRQRAPRAPAYHSNPVGVRAGQGVSAPRAVPSRRRP
jgi:hypothetical protein